MVPWETSWDIRIDPTLQIYCYLLLVFLELSLGVEGCLLLLQWWLSWKVTLIELLDKRPLKVLNLLINEMLIDLFKITSNYVNSNQFNKIWLAIFYLTYQIFGTLICTRSSSILIYFSCCFLLLKVITSQSWLPRRTPETRIWQNILIAVLNPIGKFRKLSSIGNFANFRYRKKFLRAKL